MVKVLFVCLGNICRSPLAEGSFKKLLKEKGLEEYISADSAGTAGYHVGKLADPRSIKTAASHDIDLDHIVRKLSVDDFDEFDHISVMDEQNFEDVHTLYYKTKKVPPAAEKLFLIRDFDPEVRGVHDVHDPYWDGLDKFEEVYQILHRSNEKLIEHLIDLHEIELPEEDEETEE